MPRKKTLTIQQLKKMSVAEQQKLNLQTLRKIIPEAQKLVRSQLQKVRRGGHYPVALEKAVGNAKVHGRDVEDLTSVNPEKLNIYTAQSLFANLKDALLAESSTVKGATRIEREQDIRLFGADAAGRARHRMSYDERKSFWQFYDEFLNQNPKYLYAYRDVMSDLSVFWREKGDFLDYQDTELLETFKERIENLQKINIPDTPTVKRSGENVLSGHRNKRKK